MASSSKARLRSARVTDNRHSVRSTTRISPGTTEILSTRTKFTHGSLHGLASYTPDHHDDRCVRARLMSSGRSEPDQPE